MSNLSASLIIPTHNRLDQLKVTLNALTKQVELPKLFEVIVVADGCIDQTKEYVKNFKSSFPIHLLELGGLGPAAARNSGVQKSTGDIVIFLDDDIEVVPTFVKSHLTEHEKSEGLAVIGYLPLYSVNKHSWFSQSIEQWWGQRFMQLGSEGYRFQYGDIFTGNLSLRSDEFHQLGGFDENLRCHEDYEFGYRASEAGINFIFSYNAQGMHHDITDMNRSLRRREAEGIADVYLVKTYPDLRFNLPLCSAPISRLSRLLRWSAFNFAILGKTLCYLMYGMLLGLIRLNLSHSVNFVFMHIQDFWYWFGVSQAVTGPEMIQQLYANQTFSLLNQNGDILEINLVDRENSLAEWSESVAQERPDSIRFKLNHTDVAEIPALIGAEAVKPMMLRRWLKEEGGVELFIAKQFANLQQVHQFEQNESAAMNHFPHNHFDFYSTPKSTKEIDIQDHIVPVPVPSGKGLHLLVKVYGTPLGWLTIDPISETSISTEMIKAIFFKNHDWAFLAESFKSINIETPVKDEMNPISVIVCTRNRPEQIQECIETLLDLEYSNYEIIIVDNAPSDNKTKVIVDELIRSVKQPIRYVRENLPGLDRARNRGIRESRHNIIAFIDDDARADSNWLKTINIAFKDPQISTVTGPVIPAELETKYQNLFEFAYGGMSHGFKRRFIRGSSLSTTEKLWASGFGVGANMAFRKTVFQKVGLFDTALDVGTPSNGGGDIEMLHRIVANQESILYEPRAYMWHYHRPEEKDLEQLAFNNGRSFGIYLMTCARNRTIKHRWIFWFAIKCWIFDWIIKRLITPGDLPRKLIWSELKGAITSPWGYVQTQRHNRDLNKREKTINHAQNSTQIMNDIQIEKGH